MSADGNCILYYILSDAFSEPHILERKLNEAYNRFIKTIENSFFTSRTFMKADDHRALWVTRQSRREEDRDLFSNYRHYNRGFLPLLIVPTSGRYFSYPRMFSMV